MTTAEAIEALKDAGEFEILALRVLRILYDDCKFIIHHGVNEKGKTIKNPVDGFCLVPGSNPPRYVMAAFATNEVNALERKWIFDHTQSPNAKKAKDSDDGDLIKASKEAEKIRKTTPNAQFVLYLCTNRIPDSKWLPTIYKKGGELEIEIDILDQSRLRDCLDTKPEGQWLRKEHLKIEADLLSLSLFNHLSKLNQDRFGQEIFIIPTSSLIATENKKIVCEYLGLFNKTIHILLSKSGNGKSVISYQIINQELENNRLAIRIPGEIASKSLSIEEAIDSTLRSIHPSIQLDAGRIALSYSSVEIPFIIVIDDINRNPNPTDVIKKIISWSNPKIDKQNNNSFIRKWLIILPTWELHWESLEELFRSANWINILRIDKLKSSEAVSILKTSINKSIQNCNLDLQKLADELNYDPILLSMFSDLINNNPSANPYTLVRKVFSEFLSSTIKEVSLSGQFLFDDYVNVLNDLVEYMLIKRDLYPSWSTLTSWISPDKINRLRILIGKRKVCELRIGMPENQFSFRHDRILEYYLTNALMKILEDYTSNVDVLSDPYYYNFISRALTIKTYPCDLIDWFSTHNPLSLVASISYINPKAISSYEKEIVNAVSKVVSTLLQNRSHTSYINKTVHLLESIDSPLVLEITNSIKNNPLVSFARLANGDPYSGILRFINDGMFLPNTNYQYLDNILNRAKINHSSSLILGCKELLERTSLNDSLRIASLTLAGYLASHELATSIKLCWKNAQNKEEVLISSLWAAFRCCETNLEEILSPMINYWSLLSDDNENKPYSDRSIVAEELRFSMRRGISEVVLKYLTETASQLEPLRFLLAYLLENVDHPIAVNYVVRAASELNDRAHKTGGINPWTLHLYDRMSRSDQKSLLSNDSILAIKHLWESPTNEEWLKRESFYIWIHISTNIEELQSISPDHPQFDSVVWKRAQLGDSSVVPYVINLLHKKSHYFCIINHIWCKDFIVIVDNSLANLEKDTPQDYSGGQTNEHYNLAHLLRDIPVEDSELLLCKHFYHLKYSSLFIQAALYIGTEKCLNLVKKAILEYPTHINPLQLLGSFFGFMSTNLSDKLTQKHLINISPYLKYLSSVDIMEIVEYCIKNDLYNWMKTYLPIELENRSKLCELDNILQRIKIEYFPTDNELLTELDHIELEKHNDYHIRQWCENFYKRKDSPQRWKYIIEDWFAKSSTFAKLKILGTALIYFGDRSDIILLSKYQILDMKVEAEMFIENVKFAIMCRTIK